jgi:hypothetical protein
MKDEVSTVNDSFLKHKLLYTFKSPKSHQWYLVWVEVYQHNFYGIKFHLKSHRDSPNKYSILTGFNEARPVLCTCMAIMQEIASTDEQSSFGFIGTNLFDESEDDTKRFRVYKKLIATYLTEELFEHLVNTKKSAYMMVRKSEMAKEPNLISILESKFKILYPYFE